MTNTIWIPNPESVYVLADEKDVFVTFPASSTSRKGSENYQTVNFYTMGQNGRLKPNTQRQIARWPQRDDVNGLQVQWYGQWDDIKPKGSRTLDDRLDDCGDDFDAMWKILSTKSNRMQVSIHFDHHPYGKRFGLKYTNMVYVHNDGDLGYIVSNNKRRNSSEHARPLSELNYDEVVMIRVNTPNSGYWTWQRDENVIDT